MRNYPCHKNTKHSAVYQSVKVNKYRKIPVIWPGLIQLHLMELRHSFYILKSSAQFFQVYRLKSVPIVFNLCQSSLSLAILAPLRFIFIVLVCLYVGKLLFSGLLQLKGGLYEAKITQNNATEFL